MCGHQGRLNELMSVLRMQLLVPGARPEGKYAIDPLVFEDIKQVWLFRLWLGGHQVFSILWFACVRRRREGRVKAEWVCTLGVRQGKPVAKVTRSRRKHAVLLQWFVACDWKGNLIINYWYRQCVLSF